VASQVEVVGALATDVTFAYVLLVRLLEYEHACKAQDDLRREPRRSDGVHHSSATGK